jgi:hypothetical protein
MTLSRQRNVQQQNELSFDQMLGRAQHFRAYGVPVGVRNFLAKRGITIDTSVIVQESDGDMLGLAFGLGGILLTKDQRFFSFELELNAALTDVAIVDEFEDVTSQQNLSSSNKGIGKGFGALAIDVLRALDGS